MALEGTLRDFSLADIFQLIGLQRKTGVLTLRSTEDVVTISFLDGRVVAADSLNKRLEDRLGQVLLKTDTVGPEELEAALKRQMETLERLGHILLRNAIISREELKRALEQQILQIIFRVFRWKDGDYQFSQETSIDYDAELVTPMGAESILMEGARMLDEWPIIEKRIPHRGILLLPAVSPTQLEVATGDDLEELESLELDDQTAAPQPPSTGRLRITPYEADTFRLLDGVSTVEEIVRKSAHGEFDTCKALYTLLTRGLIREATAPELAAAMRREAAIVEVPAASGPRLPWLALALVPLLVASQLLARRNPFNPLSAGGLQIIPRVETAASWARMWGLWQILHSRATLVGSYPDNLAELVSEGLLAEGSLRDPWARAYRYVLREHSVLLAGSSPDGVPDPNLLLTQRLGSEGENVPAGRGATLVEP